jgi:regulator of replication initiation timing
MDNTTSSEVANLEEQCQKRLEIIHRLQDKIAELEKENTGLKRFKDIDEQLLKNLNETIRDLEHRNEMGSEQNFNLKVKLDSIKTLYREEVEKILFDIRRDNDNSSYSRLKRVDDFDKAITAICNLAIPENICKMKTYKDGKLKSEKTFIANEICYKDDLQSVIDDEYRFKSLE